MLFERGKLFGLDGAEVKAAAVQTVRRFAKRAKQALTPGERDFDRLAGQIVKRCRVRYVKQVIFYVTESVSFRADFVFRDCRLIVEVDGKSHVGQREKDAWRDRVLLESTGYRTLRFTNDDVAHRYLLVRAVIVNAMIESKRGGRHRLGLMLDYASALRKHPDFERQLAQGLAGGQSDSLASVREGDADAALADLRRRQKLWVHPRHRKSQLRRGAR